MTVIRGEICVRVCAQCNVISSAALISFVSIYRKLRVRVCVYQLTRLQGKEKSTQNNGGNTGRCSIEFRAQTGDGRHRCGTARRWCNNYDKRNHYNHSNGRSLRSFRPDTAHTEADGRFLWLSSDPQQMGPVSLGRCVVCVCAQMRTLFNRCW